MELAKPHLDVGIYTSNHATVEFYRDSLRLPYESYVPLGGGIRQHRFNIYGSVLKVNHSRSPVGDGPPAGYGRITLAGDANARVGSLTDPDGNRLVLVPRGDAGTRSLKVDLNARDPEGCRRFYGEMLGLSRTGADGYLIGDSVVQIRDKPDHIPVPHSRHRGVRYITIQVQNVDKVYETLLSRGVRGVQPPRTLGKVARIAFVADPEENWIEISQRASYAGSVEAGGGS